MTSCARVFRHEATRLAVPRRALKTNHARSCLTFAFSRSRCDSLEDLCQRAVPNKFSRCWAVEPTTPRRPLEAEQPGFALSRRIQGVAEQQPNIVGDAVPVDVDMSRAVIALPRQEDMVLSANLAH